MPRINRMFTFKIIILLLIILLSSCSIISETEYYQVTYLADGVVIKEEMVEAHSSSNPPIAPEKEGFIFEGWDQEFNEITEDMIINAIYKENNEGIIQPLTAQEWLDNVKFGINYHNGINENNDNDRYYQWIREEGFNAVEISVYYPDLVTVAHGELKSEAFNKLKELIDKALEHDLYVVLVFHDTYEQMWTSLNYNNEESIITMINTSLKSLMIALEQYDERVAVSFCAEPRDYTDNLIDLEGCIVLNRINDAFVKMVRSLDGNNKTRKLVITTGWSRCYGIAAEEFQMVDDEYTMVRVHIYAPGNFANSKTEETIFTKELQVTLLDEFAALKVNFVDKKIPVMIGEFGTRPKNNDLERCKWAQYFLSLAHSLNVKCFIWDTMNSGSGIANSYAVGNKNKCIWLNPIYMRYILDLVTNETYTPIYDTFNQVITSDTINLTKIVKDLITGEERKITLDYDSNILVNDGNNLRIIRNGSVIFHYQLDKYDYYFKYTFKDVNETVDFGLTIRNEQTTGYLQCFITTSGFATSRLDYDWYSSDESILSISKYSTITIKSDGECYVYAINKTTNAIGIVDVIIQDGELVSFTSRK